MAIGTRTREIFSPEWVATVGEIFGALMNCEIEVYIPGEPVYNPVTNTYTTPETSVLTSIARVQVVRSGERSIAPGDDSETQVYQFQIPLNATVINDTMQVRVTDGGLNPELETYTFYVIEYFNSGTSFEKTFYATVNSGR